MILYGYDQDGNYVHTLEGDETLVELSKREGLVYKESKDEESQ